MENLKYNKPIAEEVIFDVQFEQDSHWNVKSSLLFANAAADCGFGDLVEAFGGIRFQADFSSPALLQPTAPRIQTWNSSKDALWQAGAKLFAANKRAPYSGWDVFLPHALKGLEIYLAACQSTPTSSQFSLNYLNKFSIKPDENPASYLQTFREPVIYGNHLVSLLSQVEQSYDDAESIVVTSRAFGIPKDNETDDVGAIEIVFTLAYRGQLSETLSLISIKPLMERAHQRVQAAFEETITDEIRNLMK